MRGDPRDQPVAAQVPDQAGDSIGRRNDGDVAQAQFGETQSGFKSFDFCSKTKTLTIKAPNEYELVFSLKRRCLMWSLIMLSFSLY